MKTTMRVASFFSGIGGFDLGFQQAGMNIVFQCEKDVFCQAVLQKYWPSVPLAKDINKVQSKDIPFADIFCGGFPCQDVSLANRGKRQGLKGERSGLFFKFAELVDESKPKWVVIENVPGLLTSQSGKDFQVVLKTLDKFGYGVAWRIFDAKFFGTPQRRRRVFIVASYQSLSAASVLFAHKASTITTSSGKSKTESASFGSRNGDTRTNLYSIQHAGIGRKPEAGPQGPGYRRDGETWTLDNQGSSDALCSPSNAFGVREITGVSGKLDGNRYRAIGNAVYVPLVRWIGAQIIDVESCETATPKELYPQYYKP